MKRYRDPTPALERPRERLPLSEWIKAIVTVLALFGMLAVALWAHFQK